MNSIVIINKEKIDLSECKGFSEADFNPDLTFDCGQCFRWEKNRDGIWETP